MSQDRLLAALRRRFPNARAAFRKLGLDENLLDQARAQMAEQGVGTDDDDDEQLFERFLEVMQETFTPEEQQTLWAEIARSAAESGEEEEPEDAEDENDDQERRNLAQDAAARSSFEERFPDAGRVRVDNWGIQPPAKPVPAMDSESLESFYARFPDARRLRR